MLKECNKCKGKKALKDFYWDKTNQHYKSMCIDCYGNFNKKIVKKAQTKYTSTQKGKKALIAASEKAYIKHKEKWTARYKARYAIKKGIIVKSDNCQDCGIKCSGHALQAHHEDYTKPLDVIFLCYKCHADADRLLKNLLSDLTTS